VLNESELLDEKEDKKYGHRKMKSVQMMNHNRYQKVIFDTSSDHLIVLAGQLEQKLSQISENSSQRVL
ncbi:MAG: hypothetical protein WCO23_04605, partial [bacterium]